MNYKRFLESAKFIFELAKEDPALDFNSKKMVKSDFPYGVFLAMKDDDQYIGAKIMVGSKEQIKEAFKNNKKQTKEAFKYG